MTGAWLILAVSASILLTLLIMEVRDHLQNRRWDNHQAQALAITRPIGPEDHADWPGAA